MTTTRRHINLIGLLGVITLAVLAVPGNAAAHCDTLNGPVVSAARVALQKGDVTPVLRWVQADAEAEVREAFRLTLAVRIANPEARALADQYFFETLVRLHRQGEGEPYTGLKPDTEVDPAIAGADKALETGSVDEVITLATERVSAAIRQRFALAQSRKKHAEGSVAAGREFVEAYVEFIHYIEQLHVASENRAPGSAHAASPPLPR